MRTIIKILSFVFFLLWLPFSEASEASRLRVSEEKAEEEEIALYNFSILLPLAQKFLRELPGLKDLECSQAFLEEKLFSQLPQLFLPPENEPKTYETYRLLSLRIDPVEEEFRLVFQPLLRSANPRGSSELFAEDAALHLFFKSSSKFILKELNELHRQFRSIPKNKLGVHPGLRSASHARELLKPLLCRVATESLYKVTFMTVRNGRVMWHFGGFEVERKNGILSFSRPVEIPLLEEVFEDPNRAVPTSVQRIVRGPRRLRANVRPLPARGTHLNEVYELDEDVFHPAHAQRIRLQIDRIENPLLNSPKTVDCVSCHAAESVRRIGEIQHGVLPSEEAFPVPESYGLDSSVRVMRLLDTVNFRAFGYYDFDPVVIHRVLLESIHFQKHFKASL
jgi:hypothetical protein